MSDEPESPQNVPGRLRPQLSDLSKETTEEDLWDLEGEFIDPADDSGTPATGSDNPDEKPETVDRNRVSSSAGSVSEIVARGPAKKASSAAGSTAPLRPEPPKSYRQIDSPPLEPQPTAFSTSPPAPEPADPEPAEEEGVAAIPKSKPASKEPPEAKTSGKGEKLGLVILGVVFLGLAGWWISGLFSSIPTTRLGDDLPDFPIDGRFSRVATAETYWRAPRREGDRPDRARSEVEFIPVLSVTLDESEVGVLRVIYRDEQGDFLGDSISQSFANGVFDANASPTVEFPATDGFKSSGQYNGYRVGDDRWTVEIFEGPSSEAPGSEFKLLFSSPISTNRQ